MEGTKKEYGGCLGLLLPLWIIGQIFSLVYNISLFGLFTDEPIIPILLIGINLIALSGIILLLQFKKSGFYLFISAYLFSLIFVFICPETSVRSTTIKLFLGMCIFLILMGIKNKSTKKNGYQTLGIFARQQKSDDVIVSLESDKIAKEVKTDEEQIPVEGESKDNSINEDIAPKTDLMQERIEAQGSNGTGLGTTISDNQDSPLKNSNRKKISKKNIIIPAAVILIVIAIGCIFVEMYDWRSDEEIYSNGKEYIKQQQYEKGINELEKIQEHFIPAKALLGELYTLNDSVKRDMKRGEALLWEAFEANDTNACISLSDIYIEKGDWKKAEEIYKKGIDIGVWKGYRGLAFLYCTDELGGIQNKYKDYKKAEFYALKIANKDSWCCGFLGVIYSAGGDGIEQDYSKAFYWWDKGAKIGGEKSSQCFSNLGYLYHYGYGIKQNYKKAYESYKKAISIDDKDGYPYYKLSIMFRNGQYVKANRDSLLFYLKKAAENGNEDATVELENEF